MKIAVVGCGAVGSFYGAKLARAGEEVHFLLRSDYDVVRRRGVQIRSPQGDFRVQPRCAVSPEQIGASDLVLIALKTTANDSFKTLLPPLTSPRTVLLTLQNGLGNEEDLAQVASVDQIMGGLCFVCLNRIEPGIIHHIDHGLVMLGEYQRWPEPRTHDIATRFRNAGIPCSVTDNLARAHWDKLTWNIPFNGLGVASAAGYEAVRSGSFDSEAPLQRCLTTDRLLQDPGWYELVLELMHEVMATARALGYELPDSLAEKQVERTRTMGPYKPSTVLDFENGRPLELRTLFLEPVRQAQLAGVSVPRLAALSKLLAQLDAPKSQGLLF
ncbi:MAG TPA: 2-dehydropantoate 2-reductase [Verrucomicrobiae bacterium]|nr:2-dehydropantoate 2-reductase [Verrucomicrobiae bacterium]